MCTLKSAAARECYFSQSRDNILTRDKQMFYSGNISPGWSYENLRSTKMTWLRLRKEISKKLTKVIQVAYNEVCGSVHTASSVKTAEI